MKDVTIYYYLNINQAQRAEGISSVTFKIFTTRFTFQLIYIFDMKKEVLLFFKNSLKKIIIYEFIILL